MAGKSSDFLGCLIVIFLFYLFISFLLSANSNVVVDHLRNGDQKANQTYKSKGTCSQCKKKNQNLTDGLCPECFFN